MKKIKLLYYDNKQNAIEHFGFLTRMFNSSKKGLFISIIFIGLLVGLDYVAKLIVYSFSNSTYNMFNIWADVIYKINNKIGFKFLDYFKDIIVIVAGILGVILGLFFTTFLNIITSKYSNINSVVINQLLKQKVINRYFKFLAILVSSSIIFQFVLVLGYKPTVVSAILFSLTVVIALLAFISFGKYSLLYFNAGTIVLDLIHSCNQLLNRTHQNKKHFNKKQKGIEILPSVIGNIEKVRIIVEESKKAQFSNTDLDSISEEIMTFAIRYNSFKHTFPSNKDWHPKIQEHKRWDEVSSSEFEIFNTIGSSLLPKTIDDYLYFEKLIIKTQFYIFENIKNPPKKINLIYNQFKYLHPISFQCEFEIFEIFFNQLESHIIDNLKITDKELNKENEGNLQHISLYANLLNQYLAGFNYYLESSIQSNQLKELAKAIHNFENTDTIMQFPYKIRVWLDNYQQKLLNEKIYEKKILTPLFYTEYELAIQFRNILTEYFEKVINDIHERILEFAKHLNTLKLNLESLEFLNETLIIYNKIKQCSGTIDKKVDEAIDKLNIRKEEKLSFTEKDILLKKNEGFRKNVITEIWDVGWSSSSIQNKNLPDIFGNFYHLISKDILDKAFENNAHSLIEYLPRYCAYNILYIESLRGKIDSNRFEVTTSKLYPVIVDLLEISSIAIIMFKAYNNKELENVFFECWDKFFKKDNELEKQFWSIIIKIYEYYNQPILSLSTNSYVNEHKRSRRLDSYLKESDLVRLEEDKGPFKSFMQHYVTDNKDIYFKGIVSGLSPNGVIGYKFDNLADVFIEYYLRTRISLKELNIKETAYGSTLKREMGRDSR